MMYEQESISKFGILLHKCGLYQLLYKRKNKIFHVAPIKLDPLLSAHQSHKCCIHSGLSRSNTTYNKSALKLSSQRQKTGAFFVPSTGRSDCSS